MAMPTILIVEDELVIAKDLARNLQNLGYETLKPVVCAEDAFQLVEQSPPDLIIMDINLRGDIDGIEAARQIKSLLDVPIVYLTAYSEQDIFERAKITEPYGYLSKPVRLLELKNIIEAALYKHSADMKIKESEELHRLTLSNISDTVLITNDNGEFTYVCPNTNLIFGFSKEEVESFGAINKLIPSKLFELEDLKEKGQIENIECSVIDKTGRTRALLITVKAVQIKGGSILYTCRDISEHKLVQENLIRKSRLLEQAEKLAGVGAWEYDLVNEKLDLSNEWLNIHGYDDPNPSVDDIIPLVHPDDRDEVIKTIKETIDKGIPYEVSHRINRSSDGAERIVQAYASVEKDEAGNALSVFGASLDITRHRQAIEDLRKSELWLRKTFESLQEAVLITSLDRIVQDLNPMTEKMFGYSKDEIIGKSTFDLHVDKDHYDGFGEKVAEAFNFQEYAEFPFEMKRKNSEIFPSHHTVTQLINDKGEILGIVSVIRDLTESKKAEERFRLAMEAVNDGLWDWNMITGEVYRNNRFFSMLGYNEDEFPQGFDGWKEMIHPEDLAHTIQALEEYISGKRENYEVEFRMKTQSEDFIWILSRGKIVDRDDNSEPVRMIGAHTDISQRKEALEALSQSRKSFSSIVERSADGILVISLSDKVLYANDSAIELLGLDMEQLRAIPFGAPSVSPKGSTINVIRPDGTLRNVEMRAAATDWFSEPAHVVMLRDITERQRYEKAIQEEKDKTEKYLKVAGVMFVVLDQNGVIIRVNEKTCEVLGYIEEELLGRDWFSMAATEDDKASMDRAFNELRKGNVRQYEYIEHQMLTKVGERRLILWHNAILKTEDQSIAGIVCSGEDITQRREMETRLAQSEERYRILFERSTDSVLIVHPEGRIITANPATAILFNVPNEELIGANIKDFYVNIADRKEFREELESKGFVKDHPILMKQRDGREKRCLVSSAVWRDNKGAIIGYLSIIRDITESLELEDQLRQAQKMESIGTLAGGVAHDFNNLLTVILGYSEMLMADKTSEDEDYADLLAVLNAADKAGELVKQLLTFSRKAQTNPRPVNLNLKVQNATKLLSRTIPKMIEIQRELQENLPRINADPGQIEQVIINLAVNSKDAMPDGGILKFETGQVILDSDYCKKHPDATPGAHVFLKVRDTGSGMPKDILMRIFEPFFSTKGLGQGTGLGLAMVYGIVKQHLGHITCESEPDHGTTFKLFFPVIGVQETKETDVDRPQAPMGGHETILVVDDEEMIIGLLSQTLKKAGYKVITAENGEEALEVYKKKRGGIDLIILDIIMPGMGGYEALKELKRIDPHIPVIISSGYSPKGPEGESADRAASGFIKKPFDNVLILKTIREILDK